MNSLATLRWNHGGRKVCSMTSHRGGKITKSIASTPGAAGLDSHRERFAGANGAAADDHRGQSLAVKRDRKVAHRNCPRLSDAILKTTYRATTLANVTVDMMAARRACQPRRSRPSTRALTPIHAPSPQMICGRTSARTHSRTRPRRALRLLRPLPPRRSPQAASPRGRRRRGRNSSEPAGSAPARRSTARSPRSVRSTAWRAASDAAASGSATRPVLLQI